MSQGSRSEKRHRLLFGGRYQPGLPYEQPKYSPEKEALRSLASATSESASQAIMLQGQGFSLRSLFSPSALPTQQSSSLVSFLVGFLGKCFHCMHYEDPTDVCGSRRYDVREDKRPHITREYVSNYREP